MSKPTRLLLPFLSTAVVAACSGGGSSSGAPGGPPDDPGDPPARDLYDLRAVSRPEFPILSAPSQDGEHVFQVHGTQIVVLSMERVKACADGGTCELDTLNSDAAGAPLSRTDLDVSVVDLEERDGYLYVAGGDWGLVILEPIGGDGYHNGYVEIFREASTPPGASTSRWCMDVSAQGGSVLAVFAGMDASELRVYSPAIPTQLLRTYPLTPAQGIGSGAQAMGVERDGAMAFLAMGYGGLWRVDTTKDPALPASHWLAQGPLNPLAGCGTGTGPVHDFVHDVEVVHVNSATRYLYAGADGWGLVEIDLSLAWGATMPFWSGNPTCYWASMPPINCSGDQATYLYAQRVSALYDPLHGEVVVAASFPHSGTDNLTDPYTSYGGLDWNFSHVNPVAPLQGACADEYRVFTRPAGVPSAEPVESVAARYEPEIFFATPLNLLAAPDGEEFWLLDATLQTVHLQRQASQLVQAGAADCGVYVHMSAPITPQASLVHPDVFLSGVDGAPTCDPQNSLFRLDAQASEPTFVALDSLPGQGQDFFLGSFGVAQWVDSAEPAREFLLRGKGVQIAKCTTQAPIVCPGDEAPNLFWIDASSAGSLQGIKRIRTLWKPDPAAPDLSGNNTWNYPFGRGYSLTAVDDRPGSRLAVETRGGILHGAWLLDRAELEALAKSVPDEGLIAPQQLALLTHGVDEVAPDDYGDLEVYAERITKSKTMEPRFFDVADASGATLRVLGIADGHSIADPDPPDSTWGTPQLVFFDVSGVTALPAQAPEPVFVRSQSTLEKAAAVGLDAATVELVDPAHPGTTRAHTLVFAGGSEGWLSVFDVSALFSAQSYTELSLDLEPNVFDGKGDVIFQLDFVPDASGKTLGDLHVGALRAGMIRYSVRDSGSGSVTLTRTHAVNTPGSFGGFLIQTVDGKQRMIVADHTFYGLRAYGDL